MEYINTLYMIKFETLVMHDKIGEGGFANIYRGTWLGVPVAIKIFKTKAKKNLLVEFKKETEIVSKLRHPNVILYMGASYFEGRYCIITEYATYGSLFELIHQKNQSLGEHKMMRIAQGIACGLAYLHRNRIHHCDIKSSNIMLSDELSVKIGDFGLSKQKCFSKPFMGRVGTTHWMAPEVLRSEVYTDASDVYSFGAVLWEMITLEVPYRNLSAVQIIGSVGFAGIQLKPQHGKLGELAQA